MIESSFNNHSLRPRAEFCRRHLDKHNNFARRPRGVQPRLRAVGPNVVSINDYTYIYLFYAHAAHCSLCRSKGASAAKHAPNLHAPESTGPVQGVLRPCTLKPMQCPKGATQQTRPRSTTPVLAAGPKQHVPGGFSSSTPPQGGTPSGNLRETHNIKLREKC